MATQYQDEVAESLSGSAEQNPYVTKTGGVAAAAHLGYRSSPAVVKGTGPATVDGVGVVLDTSEAMTGASSKLVSVRNAGTEKFSVDKDGNIAHGVAWDDVMGPTTTASGLAAVTTEKLASDNPFIGTWFSHSQDDELYFTFQFPHRWNKGEIRFHLHVAAWADPAADQVVRFDGTYAWAKYGVAIPAVGSWTAITPVSWTVKPGDIYKPAIVALFSSTPTGAKESDILMVRVRRPGASDSADTYETGKSATGGLTAAANVLLLSADCHFIANKPGTTTELPT